VCRGGVAGDGGGQFGEFSPQGIATDSAGDVFVVDRSNHRVEKFDPEGHFLRTWGKSVNSGTSANPDLCTDAGPPTDVCGAGSEGTGPGQFAAWTVTGSYISADTKGTASVLDDRVYVGDQGRIQVFDTQGAYLADLPNPEDLLTTKKVSSLAVVRSGNLFIAREGIAGFLKLNATTGAKECEGSLAAPKAIAADAAGNAYIVENATGRPVHKYGPTCAEISEETALAPYFPTYPFTPGFAESTGIAVGEACWDAPDYDLYLANSVFSSASMRAYGPLPGDPGPENCRPSEPSTPKIESQGAISVESERAVVRARINPKAQADTTYFVQYATASCVPAGAEEDWEAPCAKQTSPAQLGGGAVNSGVQTEEVELGGLAPGTAYRFRFAAQSSGGVPVFGVGGTEGEDGTASSFSTLAPPPGPEPPCPNQALRQGAAALLPDCRAYEMVSPVDKNGGDIRTGRGIDERNQASPEGEKLTYTAEPAFGGQPSSKVLNQYLARRGADGWTDAGINAPLGRQLQQGGEIDYPVRETQAFTEDLCGEWVNDFNYTPLTPEGQEGFENLYRQSLCGGGFEALSTVAPPAGTGRGYVGNSSVQGHSADGSQAFFTARAWLAANAVPAPNTNTQIYDHLTGDPALRLVSVLPDGSGDPGSGTAGAQVGGGILPDGGGNLQRAVSGDGDRVYWTSKSQLTGGELYLRENPSQAETSAKDGAGDCVPDPVLACTVAVGSGTTRTFWTATPDGEEALYSEGPLASSGPGQATLYRFDAASGGSSPVVDGLRGVLGTSHDLSRIYYISTDALTGAQENEAGEKAQAGKPNLYLDETGTRTFIGTLAEADQQSNAYKLGSVDPLYNASRVTPDGSRLAFVSRAQLSGFDNTDAVSGEADAEVFTYEAGGALHCISCAASGEQPHGEELTAMGVQLGEFPSGAWGAAWIPGSLSRQYTSRVLSDDGGRIFFNSLTPLVARDTNGAQDVYEWEAPGGGGCSTEKPAYHAANGGCTYLISSGESPTESLFVDASTDGRDVFFTTEASLLPQDPGLLDIYDARAGGGFVQPNPRAPCEGEACRGPGGAPQSPTPASSAFEGPGNLKAPAARPCAKGRRKVRRGGKVRCVKRRRHAHHQRRAAREGGQRR
jgi:hypothetical protein